MSSSGLECILPYLDVHKRLSISICSSSFRDFEKQTYIYFNELEMGPSKIRINDKDYKFGEILDIEKISELDDRNIRSIKKSIRKTNFDGGKEWISMEDDVPEPGDIYLKYSSGPRLEQQKIEIINKLRHSFMEELQKYSNSETTVNPLDVFEQSVTECIDRWPSELLSTFWGSNRLSCIETIFRKHPLLENKDHSSLQQDDLSDIYPNAFKLMKSKIKEMNRKSDVRALALEMLAYKPVTVPHFNQFTVFDISPEYSNRIPDGFSIRKAFKHFLSVILTERKNIQIGKFKLEGDGIFPLPVGLKFDCEEVDFHEYSNDGGSLKIYETLIERVDKFNITYFAEYRNTFSSQMVRDCKQLYIRTSGIRTENWESELQFLENEVIFMELSHTPEAVQLVNSIRSWTNTERNIGSKLYIASTQTTRFRVNFAAEVMSGELREIGFIMEENSDQSMYLRQTENKQVELTFHKNNRLIPREFAGRYFFDRFFLLEIVDSK